MKRRRASDQKASVTGQNGIVTQTERLQVSGKTTSGVRSRTIRHQPKRTQIKRHQPKSHRAKRTQIKRHQTKSHRAKRTQIKRHQTKSHRAKRTQVECDVSRCAAPPHVTSHARGSEGGERLTSFCHPQPLLTTLLVLNRVRVTSHGAGQRDTSHSTWVRFARWLFVWCLLIWVRFARWLFGWCLLIWVRLGWCLIVRDLTPDVVFPETWSLSVWVTMPFCPVTEAFWSEARRLFILWLRSEDVLKCTPYLWHVLNYHLCCKDSSIIIIFFIIIINVTYPLHCKCEKCLQREPTQRLFWLAVICHSFCCVL